MTREYEARHIIGKCGIGSVSRSVNPYFGCTHACCYCYAVFMCRFENRSRHWGSFADVKTNAASLFASDFAGVKPGENLFFGTVTDVYQPLEKKYKLMRGILQFLAGETERRRSALPLFAEIAESEGEEESEDPLHGISFSILTKSDLILRDLDLILRIPSISVGFSLAMPNERARQIFEPGASPLSNRLSALQKCHEAGVSTFVFVDPFIPMITPIEKIIASVAPYADFVFGESLNLRYGNGADVEKAVRRYDPGLVALYREMLDNSEYWQEVQKEFLLTAEKYHISCEGFHIHNT